MIELALPTSHLLDWPLYGQIAIGFIVATFILMLYLYVYSRWLHQHLQDVRPEKQTDFLLRQWRWRNIRTIISMMAIGITATVFSYHWPIYIPQPSPAPPSPIEATTEKPIINATEEVLHLFGHMPLSEEDQALESLKQRYEQALSASYILKRCQRTADEEVEALTASLRQELIRYQEDRRQSDHQPPDIQQLYSGIISAAEGSYELFYHRTPCDAPELDLIEQQLASFVLKFQSITQPTAPIH